MGVTNALIIGAGPGGLTAALAIRQAGFEVEVFERRHAAEDLGSGVTLWPNAIAALEQLGVADTIRSLSAPVQGIEIRTANGHVLDATGPALMRRHFGEGGFVLHRGALQRALLEAVGHDRVHHETSLSTLQIKGDRVLARFEDGTERAAALAVAADGIHSTARAVVAADARLSYAGYIVWRGVGDFSLSDLVGTLSMGRGAQFGLFPLPDDQVYWFASIATSELADYSRERLRSRFSGWHEPIERVIAATPPKAILRTPVHEAAPFRARARGPLVLVGDAAHPGAPTLGQGACQALEDAVVLGRCLAGEAQITEALRHYESLRAKRTNAMTKLAHQMGVMGHWESAPACWLREQLIARSPMRARLRQLRWMFTFDAAAVR
jgi:2-polyprenyl-6-methoxyphenol hydroxylase-like FAD-dependent oxidoreductase